MTTVNKSNITNTSSDSDRKDKSSFDLVGNLSVGTIEPSAIYFANQSELSVVEKDIDDLIYQELSNLRSQDDNLNIKTKQDDLLEMVNCGDQSLKLTTEKVFDMVELKKLLEKANFDDNEVDNIRFNDQYINLFLPRRDMMNGMYGSLCGFVQQNPEINTKRIIQFPKCLTYLTKRACQCDSKCVEANSDIKYEKRCHLYDLKDINNDTSYLDSCNELAFRPVNGVLAKYTFGNNIKEAGLVLGANLKSACDGEIYDIDKMICNAYELRDECRNEEDCMKEAVFKIHCDQKENIKDVEKILGFPLTEYNVRNRRFLTNEIKNAIKNNIKENLTESNTISFNNLSVICAITFILLILFKCFTRKDGSKGIFLISLMAIFAIGLLTLHKNYLS